MESALIDTVNIFSFIKGQIDYIIRDMNGIFDTPILKGIQYAQSAKTKKINKPEQFTKGNIFGELKDINNATGDCPDWYSKMEGNGQRKGNTILG